MTIKMPLKGLSGFTLFEISIALASLSVLVGLAIAAVNTYKNDTQRHKMGALITSLEQAKTRYLLANPTEATDQATELGHIAPYLSVDGQAPTSLFNLVQGTGKPADDLDLGKYKTQPARFKSDPSSPNDEPVVTSSYDPFDINDPAAAMLALQQLAGMDPNDPEYQEILNQLNEAVAIGTIDPSELADAGLVSYEDVWMNPERAQELAALDAHDILTSGGNWADISPEQQEAYSNNFPTEAVFYGGASALNLMDPSILTPELVDEYMNNAGTWVSPYVSNAGTSSILANTILPATGSNKRYALYAIINPLEPAKLLGTIADTPVDQGGVTVGAYYSFQQNFEPVEGWGDGWTTAYSTKQAINQVYGFNGSVVLNPTPGGNVLQITSTHPNTSEMSYILLP